MPPKNTSGLMTVQVVGLGSALGVDQLGWLAVQRLDSAGLKQRYPAGQVNLSLCQSPALLVARFAAAQALIILDAYYADDHAGRLRRFSAAELGSIQRPASSHGYDLKQALSLWQVLEKSSPAVSIFGICAGDEACSMDANTVGNIHDESFPLLEKTLDAEIMRYLSQPLAVACKTAK